VKLRCGFRSAFAAIRNSDHRAVSPARVVDRRSVGGDVFLTENQVRALEKAKQEKEAHGEVETEHPGYLRAQETYYVTNLKSVGRIYQQTFIDTRSKLAFVKTYERKHAITAADMLNDWMLTFFEAQGVPLLRILTDRGSEYSAIGKRTSTRCISIWRTSITREPELRARTPTASASGSIRPFRTSSMPARSGASSTTHSMS
jgi:hypothetical protein